MATLSADGGVTLSTNLVSMRNGMGSVLVTFSGAGNFNLTASVGGVSVTRALRTLAGSGITRVGGTLSGGSSTWTGLIYVTNDLTITNHTLTIQSNTVVVLGGTNTGTGGVDIFVNANASIQSLGTELHPVTITCSNVFMTNRWGQIRHNSSQPSLYRHTFIHRAGRAPGEGHTGQAPAIRPDGTTLTFESCTISDLCEPLSSVAGYGTPGKVMFANNATLSFNDCLFQRVRMGPEIQGTALLFTNSYVMDTRGPDDADGIYLHDQQVGQTIKLVDSVFASGDDDGIDTLGSTISVEGCILRDWASVIEDAKAISAFDGSVDVRRCLIVDSTVGISAKCAAPPSSVRININNSTITGNLTNVLAQFKANAVGPIVDYRITNCVIWGADAVQSDFGATNFTIRYSDISEPWAGTGNIQADPLFVNAAAKNWRLQITSPAINAGNPTSPLDVDGTITDMGVFPFLTNASPLIAIGANWRYHDKGIDLGTNWSARLFNDSSWSNGPAQLGYGDVPADEATVVEDNPTPGYNVNDTDRYITTYFRRAFTVLNPSEFTNLVASLTYDDAAVVYLNGVEAFRVNLPTGPIVNATLALVSTENLPPAVSNISPSLLVVGTNVIAVEIHQNTNTSSDISFDFALQGQRGSFPAGPTAPVVNITAPSDGTGFITPASINITVSATDGDGTVTNVSFYQNGSLLWQTNAGPYAFNWQNVLIGSYVLTATATDNTGLGSTSSPINVTVSTPSTAVTNVFIGYSNVWKYLDTGANAGTSWRSNSFNDASWLSGQGQLGYGDGDEFTQVQDNPDLGPFNPLATDKYITTYFRRFFNVTNAAAFTNISFRLIRDDAAVVYLNGGEIYRTPNLPTFPTAILFNTTATGNAAEPNAIDTVTYNGSLGLFEGTNLLAVEIHQFNSTSSDISFDIQFTGIRTADTNSRPQVAIGPPANGAIFGTPANIIMSAAASDIDGSVTNVAFFVNGVKLGDDATSPFTLATNNVPAGSYALTAVATDNVGLAQTSAVVNVTVSTNVAPPVVFAKTPVPGSLTNLTSISVVFSKTVTGVNAGDLLIGGSPATGVSGSDSNYTFTFPQPAYGSVPITWASGHGITDVFIPAHAFATNSASANWNYTLLDVVPPTITTINPVPNSTIAALTSIAVAFSEPVTGVNANDLLINSLPASILSGSGAGPYTFSFAQPPQGVVQITWAGGHGILDNSANPFSPAPWSYTLDTNASGVVISEIMYHPSSENVLEEYIELFNKGATTVNLNGWKFSAGVSFTFSNASIPPNGYLVVAASRNTFTNKYPGVTNVVGNWTGTLNNNGEDIDLDDASGNRADSVRFADEGDWAVRQRGSNENIFGFTHRGWTWFKPHDGGGRSLELINPELSNNSGQNWGPSTVTNGTPGAVNSIYQNNVAPLILNAAHFPMVPRSTDQTLITARLLDEAAGGLSVDLFYRADGAPGFTTLAMHDDGLNGDAVANDTLWTARLPVQGNNTVMEYYIVATDGQFKTRTWPAAAIAAWDGAGPTGQVANALFQIDDLAYAPTNAQPLFKMIMTAAESTELHQIPSHSNFEGPNSQMNATFIS
ncbi:MAG TPA: Ig-like domain-containing protein, partial [Verrucomicrobiae bacterium]